jgi:hypothetical protein
MMCRRIRRRLLVTATWVDIDKSLRTPRGAYAPRENVRGPIEMGDVVHVRVPGTGEVGGALVTGLDDDHVYLSLAWHTLWDWAVTG